MEKISYSLREIEALGTLKNKGKNWEGVCPICGHHHLSISKKDGLYYCFYCHQFKGQLKEFKKEVLRPMYNVHQVSKAGNGRVDNSTVAMIPTDYKQVAAEVMQPISIVTTREVLPEMVGRYIQSIGISRKTLADMKVGYTTGDLCYVNYINQLPVNVKYRSLTAKSFHQESPTTPCAPYNIDCINPLLVEEEQIERLIITEGEKDAMTLHEAGYRYVVSIANGASTDVGKCFEAFADWLTQVKRVIVCGDTDRPGRELQANLVRYFGSKSMTVVMPSQCKDISDVAKTYGIDGVRQVIEGATTVGGNSVQHIDDLAEEIFCNLQGNYDHGYDIGCGPLTDHVFHLTDIGGLVVITGKPNAGKTDFLDYVCASLIFKCNKHVSLCSFEMPDKVVHSVRYLRLAIGRTDLTRYQRNDLQPLIQHLGMHLTHINLNDEQPTPDNIIKCAETLMMDSPLEFLVVDPYLYLDLGTSMEFETNAIKRMLTRFQSWGRQHHVWVIIVAHPRKLTKISGTNRLEKVDMYTIAGSAHWANIADFILSISRYPELSNDDNAPSDPTRTATYTRLDVLKVRDQSQCSTGSVLYVRQSCGRYDERPNIDSITHPINPTIDNQVWNCGGSPLPVNGLYTPFGSPVIGGQKPPRGKD